MVNAAMAPRISIDTTHKSQRRHDIILGQNIHFPTKIQNETNQKRRNDFKCPFFNLKLNHKIQGYTPQIDTENMPKMSRDVFSTVGQNTRMRVCNTLIATGNTEKY